MLLRIGVRLAARRVELSPETLDVVRRGHAVRRVEPARCEREVAPVDGTASGAEQSERELLLRLERVGALRVGFERLLDVEARAVALGLDELLIVNALQRERGV